MPASCHTARACGASPLALPPSRPALSARTALHQRAPCQPMRMQRRHVSRCTDMAATARRRRNGAQARRAGASRRTAQDRGPTRQEEKERESSSGACRPVHASALALACKGCGAELPRRSRARGVGQSCAPSVCCVNRGSILSVGLFPSSGFGHLQERDCGGVGIPWSPMRAAD